MTPPPAAMQAAERSVALAPSRAGSRRHVTAFARVLDQRSWSRVRLAVDAIVLYLASAAALFASPDQNSGTNRWLALCFPVIAIAVMQMRPGRDQRMYGSIVDTVAHVLGTISLTGMVTIAIESLVSAPHPVALALRFWLFGFVYVAGARIALITIRRHALRSDALATPTLIVGAGVVGEQIVKRLADEPRYGLRPVGFIDADPMPRIDRPALSVPVLGGPDDLASAIERTGARHVIIAFSNGHDHVLVDKLRYCVERGVEVSIVPRLYEAINERATLDHIGGLPLVTLRHVDPRGWQFAVKHAVDRGFAALALLAAGPLMLAIAAAVRISSPGPILFRQRRVGRDGREFDVLKFRTMRGGPAKSEFVLKNGCAPGGVEGDDRRTFVGRYLRDYSLDELPQLINVLRGDMSLVGPRPERPEFVELFSQDVARYEDRHRVKSGITGWAQVNGLRGQTSIADRVEWDNHYIRNWSLSLDLRIIVMTVAEVLRFRDGTATGPAAEDTAPAPSASIAEAGMSPTRPRSRQ
jgi:exopolysaccharide biosynthesis polyprenyl glycosylphosphotransferase